MPEVWCKRGGWIEAAYDGLGISCAIEPTMPARNSVPILFDNFVEYFWFFLRFYRARYFRERLAQIVRQQFQIVHFNHEGLWWLAHWLRPRCGAVFVMHMRTRPDPTAFARWQAATISRDMDALVFIYDSVREHFHHLGGAADGTTIFNVPPPALAPDRHEKIPTDDRLKVAVLSHYHVSRGTDRLVEVAGELAKKGRRDILFVVAGRTNLSRNVPGRAGELGRVSGRLEDYAAEQNVSDYFLFLGSVDRPERVLNACDVLARPARAGDTWSRDVIEALHAGLPVVAVSQDDGFVEGERNGLVQTEYDAEGFAGALIRLADDRDLVRRLGLAGRADIQRLCDGASRAADLVGVWQQALLASREREKGPEHLATAAAIK